MLSTANNWSVYSLLLLFAKNNRILSTKSSHCMIFQTKFNKWYILLLSVAVGIHSLNASMNPTNIGLVMIILPSVGRTIRMRWKLDTHQIRFTKKTAWDAIGP